MTKYFKGNDAESSLVGDLVEVLEVQMREWDNSSRTFSPIWMVKDPDDGAWESITEADKKWVKKSQWEKFPKTTIMLHFKDPETHEDVCWELRKTGYKRRDGRYYVSGPEAALAEAAGHADTTYFVQYRNMDKRADAIGTALGGCRLSIDTPAYKLQGDNEQIVNKLVRDGWWNMQDIRDEVPNSDTMSDEEVIAARAARGFISRPYRIVNLGQGTHEFQGVSTYAAREAQKAADESTSGDKVEEPAPLFDADIPF